MGRPSVYPTELRERAVKMVGDVVSQYDSEQAAIRSVASLTTLPASRPRKVASAIETARATAIPNETLEAKTNRR